MRKFRGIVGSFKDRRHTRGGIVGLDVIPMASRSRGAGVVQRTLMILARISS